MIGTRHSVILSAILLVVSGCASPMIASQDLGKTRDTPLGAVLVDSAGMTVYTYDADEPGTSNCTGACAAFWPPVEASDDAEPHGRFTIIERDSGSAQWAYDGMPLYGYVSDEKPGDVTGDGVDGIWHIVRPKS